MSSEIRDVNLAESGERKIEWVITGADVQEGVAYPSQGQPAGREEPAAETYVL